MLITPAPLWTMRGSFAVAVYTLVCTISASAERVVERWDTGWLFKLGARPLLPEAPNPSKPAHWHPRKSPCSLNAPQSTVPIRKVSTRRTTSRRRSAWPPSSRSRSAPGATVRRCRPVPVPLSFCTASQSSHCAPIPGLRSAGGAADASPEQCRAACCSSGPSCEVYQWCNASAPAEGCSVTKGVAGSCWIGYMDDCTYPGAGWISGGRKGGPSHGYQPPVPVNQSCPSAPTCAAYDDGGWRKLGVPHDFIVEGTFTPDADRNHGYLPYNVGWYRKHFQVAPGWKSKNIWLDFDGVYRASDYWLNGVYLGHHESGYTPFRFYLHNATAPLYFDRPNVLAVRVDALTYQEGWFYEGGGIYRHVTITSADRISIVPWGVYAPSVIKPGAVITGSLDGPQTASAAVLSAQVDIANGLTAKLPNATVNLNTTVIDADERLVVEASSSHVLPPGGWARVSHQLIWPTLPPQAGWQVQMADCQGATTQRFTLDGGAIKILGADGSELCLDSGDAQPSQTPMDLHYCDAAKLSQKWTYMTTGPCKNCVNHILAPAVDGGQRCLDIFGVTGPGLDLYGCIAQPSQEFRVNHLDGAISSSGRCLTAVQPSQRDFDAVAVAAKVAPPVQLWNLARPYLYTLVTTLSTADGTYTDTVNVTFGVRSAVFDANRGFLLNGLPQKVKGLSMHQDFGGCGTAVPDRANEYRITSLKEMGATGWRTAHNPVNKEILDFADRHGMLVWSENRNLERQVIGLGASSKASRVRSTRRQAFTAADGTLVGAEWKGVDPMYLADAQAMVLRDRNHPRSHTAPEHATAVCARSARNLRALVYLLQSPQRGIHLLSVR